MVYRSASGGVFHGDEHIEGTVFGRPGVFALEHEGTFAGEIVHATWSVTPGAGSGELAGLRGAGGYTAWHGVATVPYELELEFHGDA